MATSSQRDGNGAPVSREFTCEACGRTFTAAWSDEDARAELAAAFPEGMPAEEEAVVCEDCWSGMREAFPTLDARYRLEGL